MSTNPFSLSSSGSDVPHQRPNDEPKPILDKMMLTLKNRDGFQKRNNAIGFAKGDQGSQERKEQVEELWKKNIQDLHIHISREKEGEWRNWLLGLKEGTSLLMSAVRHLRQADNGPNWGLLKRFRPENEDSDNQDWRESKRLVKEAYSRWGSYCRSFHTADTAPSSSEYSVIAFQRHQAKDPERYNHLPEVHGRRFRRQIKRVCRVYWLDDENGNQHTFELTLNKDTRLPKKIDNQVHDVILNVVGEGFRFDSINMNGISFQYSHEQIKLHKDCNAITKMWSTERVRLGETVSPPQIARTQRGEPFFNGSIASGKRKYSDLNSINPDDAIFILKEYLKVVLTPGQYHVLSFAPDDVYEHYLSYKRRTTQLNVNSHHQIICFESSYSEYLRNHHLDKERREDSLIKLQDFNKEGLAGSTIFIKSIQMLCACEKKVATYPALPINKRKTTTELHFDNNTHHF